MTDGFLEMRRRMCREAAEMEVMDRHNVTIPAADWEKFEEWANAPAKIIPALRRLAATRSSWEG